MGGDDHLAVGIFLDDPRRPSEDGVGGAVVERKLQEIDTARGKELKGVVDQSLHVSAFQPVCVIMPEARMRLSAAVPGAAL